MAQNDDGRDEIDEAYDLPSVDDLIDDAERSGSFDDFLEATQKRSRWQKPASGVAQVSGELPSAGDGTSSNSSTSVPSVIVQSELEIAQKTAELKIAERQDQAATAQRILTTVDPFGPLRTHQDKRDSEVPHPAIVTEVPEPPATVPEIAPQTIEKITLHNHPIIGVYTSSAVEIVPEDDDLRKLFINVYDQSINEMKPEQILDMIHDLNKQAVRKNTAEMALRAGLEIHLGKMNMKQRADLLERDMNARRGKSTKTASARRESSAKGSFKHSDAARAKSIKAFKDSLMMTRDEIDLRLTSQEGKGGAKFTDEDKRYLDFLFA